MARFATELDHAALPAILRYMASIVGWSAWRQRAESLKGELSGSPYWEEYLRERHGLELAFSDAHKHLRTTGRIRWPPQTDDEYRLYSFLAGAVGIHSHLSADGQARFKGALRNGLDSEFGLGPLSFEVKTAVHLVSRGFDVEFHDLEDGGGYDFLAVSGANRIEVECKHLSADVGRQIHRREFHALGGVLKPVIERALQESREGLFVRVTLPGRLSGNKVEQQAITSRISTVLRGEIDVVDDHICAAKLQSFVLENSPFKQDYSKEIAMEDIQRFLLEDFGIENRNVFLHWHPGRAAILVSIESKGPDRVLRRIFKSLKDDAKKQFSGRFPAVLCLHLADLTEAELLELADVDQTGTPTGLARMASALLQSRPHLFSVAIMTDGNVQLSRHRHRGGTRTSMQEKGPCYLFHNPDHAAAGNQALEQIFE